LARQVFLPILQHVEQTLAQAIEFVESSIRKVGVKKDQVKKPVLSSRAPSNATQAMRDKRSTKPNTPSREKRGVDKPQAEISEGVFGVGKYDILNRNRLTESEDDFLCFVCGTLWCNYLVDRRVRRQARFCTSATELYAQAKWRIRARQLDTALILPGPDSSLVDVFNYRFTLERDESALQAPIEEVIEVGNGVISRQLWMEHNAISQDRTLCKQNPAFWRSIVSGHHAFGALMSEVSRKPELGEYLPERSTQVSNCTLLNTENVVELANIGSFSLSDADHRFLARWQELLKASKTKRIPASTKRKQRWKAKRKQRPSAWNRPVEPP
jgi:hypothetical protein